MACQVAQWPPAGQTGDLVVTRPDGDGARSILFADVCGNGAAAADTATRVREHFLALTAPAHRPGLWLAQLNQRLVRELPWDTFVTAVALHLDATNRQLRIAIAGHLPPYLCRRGRAVEQPACPAGPPLGIVADQGYLETRVRLCTGDLVLLATDGVSDRHASRTDVTGEAGLGRAIDRITRIARPTGANAGSYCRRLLWTAAPLHADATVLAAALVA